MTLITQPFCGPGMIPSTAGCDTLLACPSLAGEQKVWIGLYWIGEWPAVVTPPICPECSPSRQCRVLPGSLYIIYYLAHWVSDLDLGASSAWCSVLYFLFFFSFYFQFCFCSVLVISRFFCCLNIFYLLSLFRSDASCSILRMQSADLVSQRWWFV